MFNKNMTIENGICYFDVVGSTNDEAKELAQAGAQSGTVVVAFEQTKGRGRPHSRLFFTKEARKWYSPAKEGLYFSIIIRPKSALQDLKEYVRRSAEVICASISKNLAIKIDIEWPNDLLIDGKKVGGILLESVIRGEKSSFLILGLGLNLNQERFPPDLKNAAISFYQKTGKKYDIKEVAQKLKEGLNNEFC